VYPVSDAVYSSEHSVHNVTHCYKEQSPTGNDTYSKHMQCITYMRVDYKAWVAPNGTPTMIVAALQMYWSLAQQKHAHQKFTSNTAHASLMIHNGLSSLTLQTTRTSIQSHTYHSPLTVNSWHHHIPSHTLEFSECFLVLHETQQNSSE